MNSEQRARLDIIGQTLRSALAERKDCDWSRETLITMAAQASLDEVVTQFVFENGTREQVRSVYKQYAEMHLR